MPASAQDGVTVRCDEAARVAALLRDLEHGTLATADVCEHALRNLPDGGGPAALAAIERRRVRTAALLAGARELADVGPLRLQYRELERRRADVIERLRAAPAGRPLGDRVREAVQELATFRSNSSRIALDLATAETFDDLRWCSFRLAARGVTSARLDASSNVPLWMRFSSPRTERTGDVCWLSLASYGECPRDLDAFDTSCRTSGPGCTPGRLVDLAPPGPVDDAWVSALNGVRALLGTEMLAWDAACKFEFERRRSLVERVLTRDADDRAALADEVRRAFGEVPDADTPWHLVNVIVLPRVGPPPPLADLLRDDALLRHAAKARSAPVATLVCEHSVIVATRR